MRHRTISSWWAARLVLGLALCVQAFPASKAQAAGRSYGVELRAADDSRVVFEVDLSQYRIEPSVYVEGTERIMLPGFGSASLPGEPLIPSRRVLLALPPDGGYTLRTSVLRSQPLGRHRLEPVPFPEVVRDESGSISASDRYRIDPAVYNQSPATFSVSGEPVARIRHQRVLPVLIQPLTYDPVSGETILATSMRIEVVFTTGVGGRLRRRDGPPIVETDGWERIFSRILVNPEQGRKWRSRRPAPEGRSSDRLRAADRALSGPLLKLKVRESTLHSVRASSVLSKGFPPGTPNTDLHLFKRVYDTNQQVAAVVDIPYTVVEDTNGTAGVFDADDELVFFGQRLRHDDLQGDAIEKFSEHNVYWLGDTAGPMMSERAVPPGYVSDDTLSAVFAVRDTLEEDRIFLEESPPGIQDFYYFNFFTLTSLSLPFSVNAIDPGGTLRVRAEFLGGTEDRVTREVFVEVVNSQGTTPLTSAFVPRKQVVQYASQTIPAANIDEGVNTLRLRPTSDRTFIEVHVNRFSIEYSSPYRASGNVLHFSTGTLAGDTSVTVTGLSGGDVRLFEVTDPRAPSVVTLTADHFTDVAGGTVLSFRDQIASERRYALTPMARITEITATDIVPDTPSGLIGHPLESGVDILVVSHADFIGEIARWVSYRRAQGYRVLLADAQDVFDEFNGGVPGARGIKNFVRHFFDKGSASYVLLVGDSSEDNKKVHTDSGTNFVPTESFSEHVLGGGFDEDGVVTSDKWYVLMDNDYLPGQGDFYPDLFIGRIPAGTVSELRIVLDKIFAYEKPRADDFWRRRMIRVADDAWSFGDNFQSCYQPAERGFETAEENAAQIIESSITGGFDVVRFFLSNRIDHPTVGTCVTSSVQTNRTRLSATPALLGEMNKGATVVSIQSHMNRYQACHEVLLTHSATSPDGLRDYRRYSNTGRPFVLYGMGCHLGDYALHRELDRTTTSGPNGDSFAEQLLFLNDKGALASYSSTGFEYLNTNLRYTSIISEVFFEDPPTDSLVPADKRQARWILGELMTIAEIEVFGRYGPFGPGDGAAGQVKRYHVLGDPLLRMDAGPPRFEVTVNGQAVESGDRVFAGAGGDTISVRAEITDEVAIEKTTLAIAGEDSTSTLTRTELLDQGLDASRKYEVRFRHKILPKNYDIILRAHQAEDTTSGEFHMVAEYVLKVQSDVELKVNGRVVRDGDLVPRDGDYLIKITFPVLVQASRIAVNVDGSNVTPINLAHPTPEDSTTWLVSFSQSLPDGQHTVTIFVDGEAFQDFKVVVSSSPGLRDAIAYPNPFKESTYFVYTNDTDISSGSIAVFTTSGKRVVRLDIPSNARGPGQNAVFWDGRDRVGEEIANGVYLFVISVNQAGRQSTHRGKLVRIE
jgi:hypothetical protein